MTKLLHNGPYDTFDPTKHSMWCASCNGEAECDCQGIDNVIAHLTGPMGRNTENNMKVGSSETLAQAAVRIATEERLAGEVGKKFDSEKPPVVSGALNYFPRALMAVAMDSEYGFRKYKKWGGWRSVPEGKQRYLDADGRHMLMEPIEGLYDAESGLAHAQMHAWDALARLDKMLEDGDIELRRGNEIGPDGKPIPNTHRVIKL